ncbi:DUF6298 domain-containing protein [Wenyingzhuangia sp. IMCC45467]
MCNTIDKHVNWFKKDKVTLSFLLIILISLNSFSQDFYPSIKRNGNGVKSIADSLGNQIPDFSYAGYMASEKAIPTVENKIVVSHQTEDATEIIQAAIDYVSNLKADKNGIRGAVLLSPGVFKVNGTLYLKTSGVVLRGSGTSKNGTVLQGTGVKREAVIRVLGVDDKMYKDTLDILSTYTPLGSNKIWIKNPSKIKKNDEVLIHKPITEDWIKTLGTDFYGGETGWIGWKTRDFDINWNRQVRNVNGNEIELSAPLTMALNKDANETTKIITYTWPGRIENVGVENLMMISTFDVSNPKDEEHRWLGIAMKSVKNAWVRQVHFKHFVGGAVSLLKTAQQITVQDCIATEPVSEIAAFRRHTFYTEGQQTLFQRCYSEYGYHDFAVGGLGTTGPNAFVQCESHLAYSNSGAIGSWATGVLFDIAYIDGQALSYNNREQNGRGAGWTAANSVIWETSASKIECYSPPTAQNWAFGVWGQWAGNGHWSDVNNHISPRSLFYAQLQNRLETLPFKPYVFDVGIEPTSSPTIEQATELTQLAQQELKSLPEWIAEVSALQEIPIYPNSVKNANKLKVNDSEKTSNKTLKIQVVDGKITANNKLVTGKKHNVMWWRGSLRKRDVAQSTPHITRFVPGKRGTAFTDNINEVVDYLKENNIAALDHNYGLWYDRRMDDHERIRRIDADVWPPFYEQPFARTGQGLAWDHLSKYDLTKYNTWYWDRLQRFANASEVEGKILIHQQYFQHNIIEAGAHWSSSPWRSINNVNGTDFPEPPPYAGDKRIFMAEQFYDVSNENRKKLHQQYIQKSFDNFKDNSNVIQFTSEEYTGPLHFMQFWIDEAAKWKNKNGNKTLVGLAATKDVQDAILKDKERSKVVDVIDIKYWHYREDGTVYAPEGGKNLAPRQHARKMNTGKETDEQVYRAVREYREKYPDKMVLYSTHAAPRFGWSVLMAGGSLPSIPMVNVEGFNKALALMNPTPNTSSKNEVWSLENRGESYVFYFINSTSAKIDLSNQSGKFNLYWIDSSNGELISKSTIKGGEKINLKAPKNKAIAFIRKK